MFAAVVVAVARGHADWGKISWQVWLHLVTIATTLALTPVMLLRPKGTRPHRALGWVWAGSMMIAAGSSFLVRVVGNGQFSVIHLLSALVLVQVPLLIWRARTHQVVRHRRIIRMIVGGGLLIAGFFTFASTRLLGHWLFA